MESPHQDAGANVERTDISKRRGMSFRFHGTHDDQIFVDNAGRGDGERLQSDNRGPDPCADRFGRFLRTKELACRSLDRARRENSLRPREACSACHLTNRRGRASAPVPTTPESNFQSNLPDAASSAMTFWVERIRVENTADHERTGFQRAFLARIEYPCFAQFTHILPINLLQRWNNDRWRVGPRTLASPASFQSSMPRPRQLLARTRLRNRSRGKMWQQKFEA